MTVLIALIRGSSVVVAAVAAIDVAAAEFLDVKHKVTYGEMLS